MMLHTKALGLVVSDLIPYICLCKLCDHRGKVIPNMNALDLVASDKVFWIFYLIKFI